MGLEELFQPTHRSYLNIHFSVCNVNAKREERKEEAGEGISVARSPPSFFGGAGGTRGERKEGWWSKPQGWRDREGSGERGKRGERTRSLLGCKQLGSLLGCKRF